MCAPWQPLEELDDAHAANVYVGSQCSFVRTHFGELFSWGKYVIARRCVGMNRPLGACSVDSVASLVSPRLSWS